MGAWLVAEAWRGKEQWTSVIPEGVDDLTLHGDDREIRAQLKSRHDPRAVFSIAELADYLSKAARDLPDDWILDRRLALAVVLERPVAGLLAGGFGTPLADSNDSGVFHQALAVALPDGFDVEALLKRSYLVVEANPIEQAVEALSSSGLELASLGLVAQMLRELTGKAADDNFNARPPSIKTLGRTDVQAGLDHVLGLVDPAGYQALTAGLAEIASFTAPHSTEGFYEGVNTAPGHVGAGLVFERPEAMTDVLGALETRRVALIAGPSGAGKSALAWLCAYHSRHAVRWYRLRGVLTRDVGRLAELARRLGASPQRPVGFVVDDAGRDDTAGWDDLVRETEANPGLLLIGTVREEDLFLLSTAARTPTVRAGLTPELAERIWRALSDTGVSKFSYWKEPFEQSRGLLLEFLHLLTAGRRLAETLREQVRRRLAEDRGAELLVLQAVAFASANGGALVADRLRERLNLDSLVFAKALNRLIDEHAVRLRADGAISGLHEIRSAHLDEAIQELLGNPRDFAVAAATATLSADTFGTFIPKMLRAWPETQSVLLDGLVARLNDTDVQVWIGIFHGLGLATADIVAQRWLEISRDAEIEDRASETMFGLIMADATFGEDEIFAAFNKAKRAFQAVEIPDLRKVVVDRLSEHNGLPTLNVSTRHDLTAALMPIRGATDPPKITFTPEGDLSDGDLIELTRFLETLRDRDLEMAETVIGAAGGVEGLLERVHQATPWSNKPELGLFEGQPAVTGHLRYVHLEAHPKIEDDAREWCRRLASVAPRAKRIVCDVLAADGLPYGIGDFSLVTFRLDRDRALPSPARVAWNRAQSRAVNRLVAAPSDTQRTTYLASAIRDLADWVRQAGDLYCRGERPGKQWQAHLLARKLVATFVSPPSVDDAQTGPLAQGSLAGHDNLHSFITGLQRLMTELTDGTSEKPGLMAARTADLAREAKKLQEPAIWRNAAQPPISELDALEIILWDIRAVLGDAATMEENQRIAALRFSKTSKRNSILARAAQDARLRAQAQLETQLARIRAGFADRNIVVEALAKPSDKDSGWLWPDAEFVALFKVENLIDFARAEPLFIEIATKLDLGRPLTFAPVIHGYVLPYALVFVRSLLPNNEFAVDWSGYLPYPSLPDDPNRQLFDNIVEAVMAVSAIETGRDRNLNSTEEDFLSLLVERYTDGIARLAAELARTDDELLGEVVGLAARMGRRVAEESESGGEGQSLAAELTRVLRGEITKLAGELLVARLLLMEHAAETARAQG